VFNCDLKFKLEIVPRETIGFLTLRQLIVFMIQWSWRSRCHSYLKFSDGSRNNYMRGPSQLSTPLNYQPTLRIYAATKAWAQFGGGHGRRVPPLFRRGGHNMPCPHTFFSLVFVFGEVSTIKVTFVTFCVKRFSC